MISSNLVNPNLTGTQPSPIMEVQGWLRDAKLPGDLPLIDLSQAAPAEPPPEVLRQHMADALMSQPGAHFYGPVLGNRALRGEIAKRWSTRYDTHIVAYNVAVTAGCNQAFCVAVATACKPGDAVMLPYPWYFNHKMWLDMAGIDCVPLPVDADMLPDLAAAKAAMTPNVRAVALVTPNNPTGAEYPDDLLHAFYDLAEAQNAILIVDETYRDFHAADGPPHTLFQRSNWMAQLVHLYSFSKVYRLTGHRTGAMITGAARIQEAEKFLDTMTICAAQTGQIAALHGLRTLDGWVAEQRAEILDRRTFLTELFAERLPDWTLHGTGAYFAWATPPGEDSAPVVAKRLLDAHALLVLPGTMFVPQGVDTRALRIAFANADREGLTEMARRLGHFVP
ncbi:MAG: aminotransferase [Pseudomonadota bacterium]